MKESVKQKILIIVPTVSAGGSERFVSILFNHLDRSEFEVKLVILNSSILFYDLTHKEDIFFLNKKDVRSSFSVLLKIIRAERPSIIFSTITSLNILLSFIRICYPRFLLFIRESTILSIHFKRVRYSFLYEIPIKLLYRFADKIICQSQDMLRDLHKQYGMRLDKLIVINNPSLVDRFSLKTSDQKGKPRLITVARLDAAKGYERIIKALAFLKIDFEYIIVGDFTDPMLRKRFDQCLLETGLGARVKCVGMSTAPEEYLQQSDVYIHGSYYEGFPNVLLEAGLVGLPVVSFNTAGVNEILVNEVNSFIVPDDDLKAFAHAIERVVDAPFDRSKIRALITSRFNLDTIIHQYQDLFNSKVV